MKQLACMKHLAWVSLALIGFSACKDDDDNKNNGIVSDASKFTVKVENVCKPKDFVESGTFKGDGTPPVILPGSQVSFTFSAGKKQNLSFVTMYGWSNDMFFAPANPGIKLYGDDGKPRTGDVSSEIKLWDNGTRKNQVIGGAHPAAPAGMAEADNGTVTEINGTDAQGNSFLSVDKLMKVTLDSLGNSMFKLTIENISKGTTNETPFSPGVWAVNGYLEKSLNDEPFYKAGDKSTPGLTAISEMGNNQILADTATNNTGVTTGLSPTLIVVYTGDNPLFTAGQADKTMGLANIAQEGDATKLMAAVSSVAGVKKVYLAAPNPVGPIPPGNSVSVPINVDPGDKVTFASMFGSSNDWFYSFDVNGIDFSNISNTNGDLTGMVKLWDDGTEADQYAGAGNNQALFNPNPNVHSENGAPIKEVSETYIPTTSQVIKISISK